MKIERRGGWNKGITTPQHIRNKISIANKGKVRSSEEKYRLSQSHLGNRISDETKEKIRLALRGNKNAIGNKSNRGRKMPDSQRDKLRKYMLGRYIGDKHPNWKGGRKLRMRPLKTRFQVFIRDEFKCQYCGRNKDETTLQVDHIHPKSKGGFNKIENYITSCRECNLGKGDSILNFTIK